MEVPTRHWAHYWRYLQPCHYSSSLLGPQRPPENNMEMCYFPASVISRILLNRDSSDLNSLKQQLTSDSVYNDSNSFQSSFSRAFPGFVFVLFCSQSIRICARLCQSKSKCFCAVRWLKAPPSRTQWWIFIWRLLVNFLACALECVAVWLTRPQTLWDSFVSLLSEWTWMQMSHGEQCHNMQTNKKIMNNTCSSQAIVLIKTENIACEQP